MYARQVSGHNVQRTDLIGLSAINPLACLDDHLAHGTLFERLELSGYIGGPHGALLFAELLFGDAILERLDLLDTRELIGIMQRRLHLGEERLDALFDHRVDLMDGIVHRCWVYAIDEALLLITECRNRLLRECHGGKHVLFGNLIGASLHHGDVVLGAGDRKLEIGVFLLSVCWIHDELTAVLVASDANTSRRSVKWSATHHEGRRRASNTDSIRRIVPINNESGSNNVHLFLVAIRKTGTDGAIDHTRCESAFIGGLCLALEVSSGYPADSIHLLHEIHC